MTNHRSTIIALVVGLGLAINIQLALKYLRDSAPASDWVNIESLIVRDEEIDGDPTIIYQRTIKKDVRGTWIVSVRQFRDENDRIGVIYQNCTASGSVNYRAGAILPPAATKLSWLMDGKLCHFGPGIYRVDMSITVTPDGYASKTESESSNYFFVPKRVQP